MTIQEVKEKLENGIYEISNDLLEKLMEVVKEEEYIKDWIDTAYEADSEASERIILESILSGLYASYGRIFLGLEYKNGEV